MRTRKDNATGEGKTRGHDTVLLFTLLMRGQKGFLVLVYALGLHRVFFHSQHSMTFNDRKLSGSNDVRRDSAVAYLARLQLHITDTVHAHQSHNSE